ncbi:MAG: hypothetical protein IJ819_03740 [Clostridiales bacterium]|nr:hypothetical protein [Clostridiales bacterium]
MKRKEVKVEATTVKSRLIPKALIGKNGIRHEITKVLFCAHPTDDEFEGIRYTVSFSGAETYLYLIDDRWYVQVV